MHDRRRTLFLIVLLSLVATVTREALSPARAPAAEPAADGTAPPAENTRQDIGDLLEGLSGDDQQAREDGGGAAENPPGEPSSALGLGQTEFFGIVGEGAKFVFVIDRSASMADRDGRPMAAAQHEFIACLQNFTDVQQLYIVYYNHEAKVFNPAPVRGRLAFATGQNKRAAETFIRKLSPDGGTNHFPALLAALRMRPDVVFLLTDGNDEDDLQPEQLAQIRDANITGATIHVVQFTATPQDENGLMTLAKQNRGRHVFVDIDDLPEAP